MTTTRSPQVTIAIAATALLGTTALLTACSAQIRLEKTQPKLTLTSFDTCEQALKGFTTGAKRAVGPAGFSELGSGDLRTTEGSTGAPDAAPEGSAKDSQRETPPEHSGTNNQEKGVDEPDLVKTDGTRIYTLAQEQLKIVDTQRGELTGTLSLSTPEESLRPHQLLIGDEQILVVMQGGLHTLEKPAAPNAPSEEKIAPDIAPMPTATKLVLIDVADAPQVKASLTIEGDYVDARQINDTVRLVTRSGPRLNFDQPQSRGDDAAAIQRNKEIIEESTVDQWLPRYISDDGTTTTHGRVPCGNVSHPAEYSGASLLSVFSFDLSKNELGTGDPTTIAADGGTVYATGKTLYVANQRTPYQTMLQPGQKIRPDALRTEFYSFDISGNEKPKFLAAGWVPGLLLNQYSISEHEGYLRAATTGFTETATCCEREPESESAVYVLHREGQNLQQVGSVGGLGKGEQIYAVRFVGAVGYVVTFKQTDPLYTVDLSEPSDPQLVGELKITGYSAYLHPAAKNQLIGVGQEATEQGRTQGSQVSLFNIKDPADPHRVANIHIKNSQSAAEFDPHAFLYWEKTGLLVIPITTNSSSTSADSGVPTPTNAALLLRIGDGELTELGTINHPTTDYLGQIQRSLLIGDTLWTISDAGAMGTDPDSMQQTAWVAF